MMAGGNAPAAKLKAVSTTLIIYLPKGDDMSMFALFYTLPTNQIDALIKAAKDEEKDWDAFSDFLDEQALEQDTYNYSAGGFLDLDLILMNKKEMIWSFCDQELSNEIYEIRNESIAVFDKTASESVFIMLSEINLSEADILEYFQEKNLSAEDEKSGMEAIFAAFDQAQKWFSSVQEDEIGILLYS